MIPRGTNPSSGTLKFTAIERDRILVLAGSLLLDMVLLPLRGNDAWRVQPWSVQLVPNYKG